MNLARASLLGTLLLYFFLSWTYLAGTPVQEFYLPDSVPQMQRSAPVLAGIGPDEKEYLIYVRSLAERGVAPRPTLEQRKSPDEFVCYQAQHPSLFFLLSVPLWKLFAGQGVLFWTLWRGLCALLGATAIALAAKAARLLFPESKLVALCAAPLMAFVPIFGHLVGHVSNEPLALALGAWAWLLAVRYCREARLPSAQQALYLGFLLGSALQTRLTAVIWCFALVVLLGMVFKKRALRPLVFALGLALVMQVPWLATNMGNYGKPLVRPFDNPLLANGATLGEFFGAGIRPPGSPTQFTPLITVLFWAATGWTPFWLIGGLLPGSFDGMVLNAAYLLLCDLVVGLTLFWNASQVRRKLAPSDPVVRAALWAAGGALLFLIAVVFQQMLFVDWNVLQSAGRYFTAAAPLLVLFLLTALEAITRKLPASAKLAVGGVAALALFLASLHTTSLVRQFYAGNPTQKKWQKIAPAGSGRAYIVSDTDEG
ncbi:hypothetical protein [Armatimonas rosea]|uniref:Glycosyltransferase RgtA/B/C/D-like domain-containing protein n=1 Tax=Armatimonas rosea TaxID=685828 RepID=A0A7W9SQP6_ARMRO|nr:hypothetical protein [Armatimonas rosea]MBB6051065.1 hypothetical protein [Armatimonas rosea]